MICDRIDNSTLYGPLSGGLSRALEALRGGRFAGAPPGRHEIDGDRLFALVQQYTTRPAEQCKLESHRQYIDVQAVLGGEEAMGWAPVGELDPSQAYDPAKECALYQPYAGMSWIRLRAGEFAIFFPGDAHLPCAQSAGPSEVRKIVIKVRVEP